MTMIIISNTHVEVDALDPVCLAGPGLAGDDVDEGGTNLTASCSTVERRPPSSLASRLSLLSSASMLLLRSPLGEDPNLRENSSAE